MQPMVRPAEQTNWLARWVQRRAARCGRRHSLGIEEDTHARTFSTSKSTQQHFSRFSLGNREELKQDCLHLFVWGVYKQTICTLCRQNESKTCLIPFFMIPVNKYGRKESSDFQPPQTQHCQPYWSFPVLKHWSQKGLWQIWLACWREGLANPLRALS